MKRIIFFIISMLFVSFNSSSHSIVGEIRIFYNMNFLTFQKEDDILTINILNDISIREDSVVYQYINSQYINGYYYFLFFAKSWHRTGGPFARGEWGAGQIKTVFIIRINENFTHYEIINQYLSQFIPREYMMSIDGFRRNGTSFFWYIEGQFRNRGGSRSFSRIVIIDANNLENGFDIYERIDSNNLSGFERNEFDLVPNWWWAIENVRHDNNEYLFNWR